MTHASVFDTAVVGAGAAGLMAAIQCRRRNLQTVLLDSRAKFGAKILMSGGTRCNVTNETVRETDFASEKPRIVRNILRSFPPKKTKDFFKALGVTLIREEGGKYFPSTHSGRTVLEALTAECRRLDVILETPARVENIHTDREGFSLEGPGKSIRARTVILCTGGLSYPATGSDGTGYRLAQTFGHTLVAPSPSLTPLILTDSPWQKLSGVSLPVRLTLEKSGKKIISFEGPLLFTHFGISGPCALNISRYWIRNGGGKEDARLSASFLPGMDPGVLLEHFSGAAAEQPSKTVLNFMLMFLPARVAETIFRQAAIPPDRRFAEFRRKERQALADAVLNQTFPVAKGYGYTKAEVTAGGVPLHEIDYRTMQSRCRPGLFLAGEILDADGRIGGFNFQWAWATGNAAARGAAEFLKGNSVTDEA